MLDKTVTLSSYITEEESKENLHMERESLIQFAKDCIELLHIKDIDKFKNEYVRTHCNLCKDELIVRLSVIDDLVYFLKNYKVGEI